MRGVDGKWWKVGCVRPQNSIFEKRESEWVSLTHLDDGVEELLRLAGCLGHLALGVRVVVRVVRPLALVPLRDAGGGGGERVSAECSAA